MSLPTPVADAVERLLGARPERAERVGGGSINEAAHVVAGGRDAFVKWHRRAPAGFFEAEADGLARLRATDSVRVPEVLGLAVGEDVAVLALSWHPPASPSAARWREAGEALARLHAVRGPRPGLERDNVMGAVPQDNRAVAGGSWIAFFRERRLRPLLGDLPAALRARVEALDLEALLTEPEGGARLLHGDLWAGNLHHAVSGPIFVDPAVYFGHPEVDLAMTRLFGGFPAPFHDAYHGVAGRPDRDLDARLEVLNLYPLLVHVRLFGGGYVRDVERIVDRYGGR
ncbi:MAG: fructosamine kinase family protein [Deltaproteobacteria bacterium]|nr:fructosamine kinase family protein [Deltaproteobacteria bacterium]